LYGRNHVALAASLHIVEAFYVTTANTVGGKAEKVEPDIG